MKPLHEQIYLHTPIVSAPDSQPLAVEYNKALAHVLAALSDQQLAELASSISIKIENKPSSYGPCAMNLAASKIEAEAIYRFNRQQSPSKWIDCVVYPSNGQIVLPGQN